MGRSATQTGLVSRYVGQTSAVDRGHGSCVGGWGCQARPAAADVGHLPRGRSHSSGHPPIPRRFSLPEACLFSDRQAQQLRPVRNHRVFHPIRIGGPGPAVGLEVVHLDHVARQVLPLDVQPMRRLEAQGQRVGPAHAGQQDHPKGPEAQVSEKGWDAGPMGALQGGHDGEDPRA